MVHNTQTQNVFSIYNGKIEGAKPTPKDYKELVELGTDNVLRTSGVSVPTITVFLAPKEIATGTSVIICPGGGYGILAIDKEGHAVAKRFNEVGITAFVLKYRLPDDKIMFDKSSALLQDAQQAIYWVRERVDKYGISMDKIGIMGFSAGGHLASTLATHYSDFKIPNPKKISIRPDFCILIYPVISFEAFVHQGTMRNLLGLEPSSVQKRYFSANKNVNNASPPTFIVHAKDDAAVPVQNSILLYEALEANRVTSELFLYDKGGHGFGLHNTDSPVDWFEKMHRWLFKNNF